MDTHSADGVATRSPLPWPAARIPPRQLTQRALRAKRAATARTLPRDHSAAVPGRQNAVLRIEIVVAPRVEGRVDGQLPRHALPGI